MIAMPLRLYLLGLTLTVVGAAIASLGRDDRHGVAWIIGLGCWIFGLGLAAQFHALFIGDTEAR